ncbi:MAG: SMP-30/gluconolactonase/LRE family protein [Rhodoglobus sp.]|nr:SMP-30/gluconolactonase/LRE family protein [Rhodoglobus sp.]
MESSVNEIVVDGLDHPECVIVGPDGELYAGSESGEIYRIDPVTGTVEVIASTGGFVLGLAIDGAGDLYVCDRRAVLRVNGSEVRVHSTGTSARPMHTPNYAAFGPDGSLYVSDSGTWGDEDGCIFRIAPDGTTEVWSEATPSFPNGLALGPRGTHLYVVESLPPAIRRIELLPDGAAGAAELVVAMPGSVPDGLAFDVAGTLYISCYRPDAIYRLSPGQSLEVFSEDPAGTRLAAPTNIAFDGLTLYVANFARWHVSRLLTGTPGLPLSHPNITR